MHTLEEAWEVAQRIGFPVVVKPQNGSQGKGVTVNALLPGGVCDNGDGIAADQLEAIFDRFRRADPSRAAVDGSGSGLGLTIARAIVRAHGGTLRATSEGVGHGATFMVRLPAPTSR